MGNIDSEPVQSSAPTRQYAATFTEHMYDMTKSELKEYMKLHSKNGICYIEFTYQQIGMGKAYFERMCQLLNQNKINIKREILLQRIRGSSESPFDQEDLDIINDNRKPPIAEEILMKKYVLYIYRELNKNQPYLVGIDCASGSGVGSDNTAMVIVDPSDLAAVAVLVTPYVDAVESAKLIVELTQRYVPRGLLCIERNNLGKAIIAILARTPVAGNLYYDANKVLEDDAVDKLNKKGYLDTKPENRRYWGVLTDVRSRNIMLNEILTYRVKTFKDTFIARELIDDLNDLIKKSSGRIEAASGKHDDVTMAFCIALYVYEHGSKLANWGIVKGMKYNLKNETKPENLTYEEIYAALPENLRSVFPNPNQNINLMQGAPQMSNTPVASEDEIYKMIQRQHARRTNVVHSDHGDIIVRDNLGAADMVEQAIEGDGNFSNITSDTFDICDIINS